MQEDIICVTICILMLLFLLFIFIYTNCVKNEHFTVPGLTLTKPPSWFPQNSAKPYNKDNWKVRMYLDRYPFWDSNKKEYINSKLSNKLASVNRFWTI